MIFRTTCYAAFLRMAGHHAILLVIIESPSTAVVGSLTFTATRTPFNGDRHAGQAVTDDDLSRLERSCSEAIESIMIPTGAGRSSTIRNCSTSSLVGYLMRWIEMKQALENTGFSTETKMYPSDELQKLLGNVITVTSSPTMDPIPLACALCYMDGGERICARENTRALLDREA